MRFTLNEFSLDRLMAALWRRLDDIPHALAWRSLDGEKYRQRLLQFRDLHRGERCFILGNGPSLASMDLSPLRKEITFGLNRIYLLFDRLGFLPSYYVCVNELVLVQFADEIRGLNMPKFLNWNCRRYFDVPDETLHFVRMRLSLSDRVQTDATRPLYGGGTVTFAALQLAYFMGFRTVVLIGVDHRFVNHGIPNRTVVRSSEKDANHFHPDYFPPGSKWQLPDLRRSEIAYSLAREAFERDGRRILDATVDGHCPVFEKIAFETLF